MLRKIYRKWMTISVIPKTRLMLQRTSSSVKSYKKHKSKLKTKEIVKIVVGETNSIINSYDLQNIFFCKGLNNSKSFWNSLICRASISGFIKKNIENYGIIKLTDKGTEYLKNQFAGIYLNEKNNIMRRLLLNP